MATTTMKKKMFNSMLLSITFFTVFFGLCSATIYKVGESDGWSPKADDVPNALTEKTYHVGDSLVFDYDPSLNDVIQVSGALEYVSCDSSSPKAVYNTGHDVVTFTEPGSYYYITSNSTQCGLGQKLDVLVIYDPSSPIPSPPPPSSNIIPFGKVYKVGDSKGWRVYDSEFYNKWSEEKQFHVGDSLLFEYGQDVNDVLEINGDLEFEYCDPTSPVSVHKTGFDLVRLTKPGVHYFISSEPGQCESGLKLRVVVGPIPKDTGLSPMDRLMKWLRTFKPRH